MEQREPTNDVTSGAEPAKPSSTQASLHVERTAPPEPIDPIKPVTERPTTAEKPRQKPRGYAVKSLLSTAQLVFGAVVLAFIINHFVFQSYQVFGQSMVPTLHEGDRLIINKLGKSWSGATGSEYMPKRGEVIVFHNPNDTEVQLIKRVVGLPGDRVVVDNGRLSVFTDESPLGFDFDEAFGLDLGTTIGQVDITVPDSEIFVIGDNRGPGGSLDSRNELGTVPVDQIVGDLAFRIIPLDQAQSF